MAKSFYLVVLILTLWLALHPLWW